MSRRRQHLRWRQWARAQDWRAQEGRNRNGRGGHRAGRALGAENQSRLIGREEPDRGAADCHLARRTPRLRRPAAVRRQPARRCQDQAGRRQTAPTH
eukprot:9937031-Alexandrium_andersonii.AAC.1